MSRTILLGTALLCAAFVAAAEAAPLIEAFTGEFVAGEVAELSGRNFGGRGLLTRDAGPLEAGKMQTRVVVVGDAATYADCENRYLLKTASWAQDRITVIFDVPDAMRPLDLYLFVVDDQGQASPGLGPLKYGQGLMTDDGPPGRPGKPTF
jgi:hypothetical protein